MVLRNFIILLITLFTVLPAQTSHVFDEYFSNKTMRIDYLHIGDAASEFITIDHIYQQGQWAGSTENLIDSFNNGRYYVKVFSASSGDLLYSRGFDSYFGEYKTSGPALEGIRRTYHESALIPYPKQKIKFSIEARDRENRLNPLFSVEIDPEDISIIKENLSKNVEVFQTLDNGNPHQKVDLAFIAEGYTEKQKPKFEADLDRFTRVFLEQEPYKSLQSSFNIYGVFCASQESGCDEPTHDSFRNTAVGATFNSMGSPRYLLTEDNKNLRDIAANVPYDALVLMVNHDRYGGGGIYNFFCTITADNQWHEYLLLHEFGHSFSGLADEYYTSSTAYNEFYPRGIEPTEPNITALLNPSELKWNGLLTTGVEVPTPWEKQRYDQMDEVYQQQRTILNQKIAALKKEKAPDSQIRKAEEEAAGLSLDHAKKMDTYLLESNYHGMVGAFEGAGYSSEGLYRPMLDCLMFSKGKKPYCKVCEQAVIRVIKHHSN